MWKTSSSSPEPWVASQLHLPGDLGVTPLFEPMFLIPEGHKVESLAPPAFSFSGVVGPRCCGEWGQEGEKGSLRSPSGIWDWQT